MTLVYGSISWFPSGHFRFNRAYVPAIVIGTGGWPYTFVGNVLKLTVGAPYNVWATVEFEPEFVPWSSNTYTMDWIVHRVYNEHFSDHSITPAGDAMYWKVQAPFKVMTLYIDFLAFSSPYAQVLMPPAPDDYWLPRPLL